MPKGNASLQWSDARVERHTVANFANAAPGFPLDRLTRLDLYAPFLPEATLYKEGRPDHQPEHTDEAR